MATEASRASAAAVADNGLAEAEAEAAELAASVIKQCLGAAPPAAVLQILAGTIPSLVTLTTHKQPAVATAAARTLAAVALLNTAHDDLYAAALIGGKRLLRTLRAWRGSSGTCAGQNKPA